MTVTFEDRINQLQEYEAEHGHMIVPEGYKEKDKLGKWVANQKFQRKKGKLHADKISQLDMIGFVWNVPKGPAKDELIEWGKNFRWLVNFHKSKGHTNVPSTIAGESVPTAAWCNQQRQLHLNGKLEQDKIDRLSTIGFDFYPDNEFSNEKEGQVGT